MKRFLLILAATLPTLLQAAIQPTFNYKHIDTRNGLSNDFILDMAIDGQGFVWSVTESGLNKLSGNGNIVYTTSNSDLIGNSLNTIYYDDPTHTLWIGSNVDGISLFDCQTQRFSRLTTDNGLFSNHIMDIMPADKHGVWIVHSGGCIDLYDNATKSITRYDSKTIQGLGGSCRCCRDGGNGLLYLGHAAKGMSIVNLKEKTARRFEHDPANPRSIPGNNVRCIYIDHLKNIWVGTNGGLALFDPLTEEFTNFRHDARNSQSLAGDNIRCITEMSDETLWVTSDLGGISILDLHNFSRTDKRELTFKNITYTDSDLSSPNIRVALEDKFGNVWVGNYSTGIDFISHNFANFQIIPYFDEGNKKEVIKRIYGIMVDHEGNLWMGGENELSLCQHQRVVKTWDLSKYMSHPYSLIYILKQDCKGNIWMGINDEGVIRYNPHTDTFKPIELGKKDLDIHAFYEDEDNNMWIGSEDGVYICRQDSVRKLEVANKQWGNTVYAICKDNQQKTWIGTLGKGVVVLDASNQELVHLNKSNKLKTNQINQIYKDRKGGLWIATYDGLAYVEDTQHPEQVTVYDEHQGLADDHIRAIQQDKQGNIWVSTYTGIACWDAYRQRFYNYDYNDGVPFGGFVESSSAIAPDGTLYFGSPHGVCYFNPHLMETDDTVSPIQITSCKKFDRQATGKEMVTVAIDPVGTFSLPYDQNTFCISFTVADYAQIGQVEYAYMMKGLDNVWYDTGGDNTITFRNIAPGDYTFRVKARLKNGEWDDQHMATMHIVVRPPVWETWWAKLLYALVALGFGYLIFRSYKKRLLLKNSLEMEKRSRQKEQELNGERLRFYTNIAHELRTPLTLIIGPLEDLKENKGIPIQFHSKIGTIYRSAVQLLNLINQLMEFRKTETQNRQLTVSKGNLSNLVTEIGLRYKELNRNGQVQMNIDVEPMPEDIYFDADIITIVLNNLMSNAVKYTPVGTITLSLHPMTVEGVNCAEIVVADTGYGIDAASLPYIYNRYYQAKGKHQASGTGIGLALVKSLVDLHHGTLEVESVVERGTTFRFRIQTGYNYPEALHKEEAATIVTKGISEEAELENALPILLVVEDNADIREYIATELQDTYKVLQARNGKEGLTLAQKHTPNIIVSDIMMPEMNGIEMCKAIKENISTSHIPVILLTAKDSIQDKQEGYDNGADSYLTKPFSAKLLRSRIKNLLETQKRLAQQIVRMQVGENKSGQQTETPTQPKLNKLDEAFLAKLTSLIEDNLDVEKIDTSFMTDRMNMSYSAFYRKVKALTELTPNEFVRKIKLRNSALWLQTGEYSIQEAALRAGFNSMAHFRDCFKEEFGVLPSEYAKQHQV